MSVGSLDRDFSRRALTQKSGNTARAGLQLDIERLFAQQIRFIFTPPSSALPLPFPPRHTAPCFLHNCAILRINTAWHCMVMLLVDLDRFSHDEVIEDVFPFFTN